MSSDELDTRTHLREDVKVLQLPHSDLNRTVAQRSSSHLISSYEYRRWMSLPNPDEPNRMRLTKPETATAYGGSRISKALGKVLLCISIVWHSSTWSSTVKARNNTHPPYAPRYSMSTRLTCVVAHVRVYAQGGGGGGLRILTWPYILYGMHACVMFFGGKDTVLVPGKIIHRP